MNKVILIGRLTKDIELKKTQSGHSVTSFTVAVNRTFQSQDPNQPTADFINCVAWNRTAELMNQYVGKGSQVAVDGRIQTRNYENQEGRRVYVTEVVVDRVQFLDSKGSRQQSGYQADSPQEYSSYSEPTSSTYEANEYDEEPILDIASDDLPF